MDIIIYDLEITQNSFIYGDYNINKKKYNTFVISIYKDDRKILFNYLNLLINNKDYQVGFNNLNYDYPLLHHLYKRLNTKIWNKINIVDLIKDLNDKNKQLIPDKKDEKTIRFGMQYNVIKKPLIKQIDLFKIHHFDNKSRRTSLKKVEINMRFKNVQDFNFNSVNNNYNETVEHNLIEYNKNDINATLELYYLTRGQLDNVSVNFPGMEKYYSVDRLKFRKDIGKKFNINVINASDVKIGEEINKKIYLEKSGRKWKDIKNMRTFREYIEIKSLIPTYIFKSFTDKELVDLLKVLINVRINVNEPNFKYNFVYIGKMVKFALGGIHSDDKPNITQYNLKVLNFEEHDVGSMYPTSIITMNTYPEHLGKEWLEGYTWIRDERIKLKPLSKKDKYVKSIVDVYKLALNGGGYGKTGDKYNYQFDPLVKYSVTIKCQLDILLYAQMLKKEIKELEIESWNTDGINIIYKKENEKKVMEIKEKWEKIIKGTLEVTPYKKIIRRDVNNYIAIKKNGNIKLKGIFELEKILYKDFSSQIINMALVEYFIKDIPLEITIKNDNNIFNFLNTIRVQNTKQGQWEIIFIEFKNNKTVKIKLQKINRYYVTNNANCNIIKKLKYGAKWSYIENRYNTKPLNIVDDINANNYNINYNYYIKKAREIVNEIENKQLKIF